MIHRIGVPNTVAVKRIEVYGDKKTKVMPMIASSTMKNILESFYNRVGVSDLSVTLHDAYQEIPLTTQLNNIGDKFDSTQLNEV